MTRARDLSRLGNSQALSVDTNFNVGINSTAPVSKLNVVGVVSATSFYGDGANLTGVVTATSFSGSGSGLTGVSTNFVSSIGIQSAGTVVGTGITQLNFVGTGNTFAVNGTTIDISIQGGGGAGGITSLDITSSLFI